MMIVNLESRSPSPGQERGLTRYETLRLVKYWLCLLSYRCQAPAARNTLTDDRPMHYHASNLGQRRLNIHLNRKP